MNSSPVLEWLADYHCQEKDVVDNLEKAMTLYFIPYLKSFNKMVHMVVSVDGRRNRVVSLKLINVIFDILIHRNRVSVCFFSAYLITEHGASIEVNKAAERGNSKEGTTCLVNMPLVVLEK
eukprot:9774781-Ditylum_brightwellii.AAC.1